MTLNIDWIKNIKPQESFFVQTNHFLSSNSQIDFGKLIEEVEGSPKAIIDPMMGITLTNLLNKNIKHVKITPNAIWAEIIENTSIQSSLAFFFKIASLVSKYSNFEYFTRIGVRKQYLHFFGSMEERKDFFLSMVNFKDFTEVGIVKSTVIEGNLSCKLQILPLTKDGRHGTILDIDLYFENTEEESGFILDNLLNKIDTIHEKFSPQLIIDMFR